MISADSHDYLIRDAFQRFFPDYLKTHPDLPDEKRKTAACIINCKTGGLGYNVSVCESCGKIMVHAVSCNNRSCPCCQAPLEKKWVLERNTELINGIAYYHVIFTMPHELNPLIQANMKPLLGLLFSSVKETLLTLCADKRFMGATPGIICVLHTWGQQLAFHPHLHVCLSGGGLTPSGQFRETRHKGFLIPEAVLADMFRGKYLCALKKLYSSGSLNLSETPEFQDENKFQSFIDTLFSKRWLPFVKETFNGKGNAIEYLARYSYRTAIANSRIVSVTNDCVSFTYKDYRDNGKTKTMTVPGVAFIGLFLQHVLPKRFNRVRFSGYLNNSTKTRNMKLIHLLRGSVYPGNPLRKMTVSELMLKLYNKDICHCPECNGPLRCYPRGTRGGELPPDIRKQIAF